MLSQPHVFEQTLRAFPFLEQAGNNLQDKLHEEGVFLSLNKNQFICMPGNRSGLLPLVLSGTARVYHVGDNGREVTLYRLTTGESCILTACCILSDRAFPAFAQAETDIEAVGVPEAVLRQWMHRYEACRTFIFGLFSGRLASIISVVEAVAFRRLDARVAGYVITAARQNGMSVARTHEQIASELGSSREVVSRILEDFKQRGLVALSRGRVAVQDVEELQEVAKQG